MFRFLTVIAVCTLSSYPVEAIQNTSLAACPGRYCGRVALAEGFSNCGACPRAHKTNGVLCVPCDSAISNYDIVFLLHVAIIYAILLFAFGKSTSTPASKKWVFSFLANQLFIFEVFLGGIIASLLQNPIGSLRMNSCGMNALVDWYPYLVNPRPTFTYTLHCANEAAFPLVTWFLIFSAVCFVFMSLVRLPVMVALGQCTADGVYASYVLVPFYLCFYLICGGLWYYSFPYLILFAAMAGLVETRYVSIRYPR